MLIGLIFLIIAGMGFVFIFLILPKIEAKNQKQINFTSYKESYNSEKIRDIEELYAIDEVMQGIIYTKSKKILAVGEMSGINFATLTTSEQDARESKLIEILSQIDYPIQFVTANTIIDTSNHAREVAQLAAQIPENTGLRLYQTMYAGQLELMRIERSLTVQNTYIFVSGKTEEEAINRLDSLLNLFTSQTEIIARRIDNTDEIYDLLLNILLPDNILRPSDMALAGVTFPIHSGVKERSLVN